MLSVFVYIFHFHHMKTISKLQLYSVKAWHKFLVWSSWNRKSHEIAQIASLTTASLREPTDSTVRFKDSCSYTLVAERRILSDVGRLTGTVTNLRFLIGMTLIFGKGKMFFLGLYSLLEEATELYEWLRKGMLHFSNTKRTVCACVCHTSFSMIKTFQSSIQQNNKSELNYSTRWENSQTVTNQ